jgi:uncharacterized protein YidB (DUF937 family)
MALGRLALALVGILAYQNRDKLGALLRGENQNQADPNHPNQSGGILDTIANTFGGTGGALSEVLNRFRNAGSGETVDSWVQQGPSQTIEPHQVEAAIDPETLDALSKQTGLSREELVRRLANELPGAVDRMTPDGKVPDDGTSEPNLLDDVPMNRTNSPTGPKI